MNPEARPIVPIYDPEKESKPLEFTPEQTESIRQITLGIEEVDERIREFAADDVIKTLENGHPLNRIIEDENQNTIGYIAFEDFVPHEAYIKYFGTSGTRGRNLLREIPVFLEYAKEKGFTKLDFHGWNKRLNRVMEHFGFKRLRTDTMGEFSADLYEKSLVEQKTPEEINQERTKAFEQKYLNRINREYEQTLAKYSKEGRETKRALVMSTLQSLSTRLKNTEEIDFNDLAQAVLRMKLARHFQNNDSVDENVLYDAIVETPKFLQSEKGSLFRLFEMHQQKTVQKIAEIRKRRAEMTGNEELNPYEALFETDSGNYYVARLLNMPHLEQESEYMNHCVGTSDSYINQIKRGDIEILSFRQKAHYNREKQKFEGDVPIITIEYNLRTKTIKQLKKASDEYLKTDDPYFDEVIVALKKLKQSTTDIGDTRDFRKIQASELENIPVSDYCLLTEEGEISFKDFNPESGIFILKIGNMEITPSMPKSDAKKILKIIEGIDVEENEIALGKNELDASAKIYIGPIFKELWYSYPNLEHIYTSFPEGKISRSELTVGGLNEEQLQSKLNEICKRPNGEVNISAYSQDKLDEIYRSPQFAHLIHNPEQIALVRLKVRDLGDEFKNGATTEQIYARAEELGLELCPDEVGPYQRIKDTEQPLGNWYSIAMKQFTVRLGGPRVFFLGHRGVGLWLDDDWARPDNRWDPDSELMFRLRKVSQEA